MAEIDRMTQQNAALVEESAAAADSLREQAARLSQVVQQFRLADGARRRRSSRAPSLAPAQSGQTARPRLACRPDDESWCRPGPARQSSWRTPSRFFHP